MGMKSILQNIAGCLSNNANIASFTTIFMIKSCWIKKNIGIVVRLRKNIKFYNKNANYLNGSNQWRFFTFVEVEQILFSLVDYIDLVLEPQYLKLFIDCSN